MEQHKFEFDHELAAQQRASRENLAREAAMAEYRATTRWMVRAAGTLILRIAAFIALLYLILWLFTDSGAG
jgi:hypothetical protein